MLFRDIKLILEQYVKGEVGIDKLIELVKGLDVKFYLPIIQKYAQINMFNKRLTELISDADRSTNEDVQAYYITYDVESMFVILNAYAGIISANEERSAENYDLVMSSGFYDMIVDQCKNDVAEFERLSRRICGIENIWILNELHDIFCSNGNLQNVEKIADIINNGLDKDVLDKLNAVQLLTSPTLNTLVNNLQKETADEVMNRNQE